jgi:hypothetical protein
MKGKGRERNSGRGFFGKKEMGRGFLAKQPSSSFGLRPGQRQGRLGRRRPAGLPATTAAGERGKREGRRGDPSPSLTLDRGGAGRELHGRRRTGLVAVVL